MYYKLVQYLVGTRDVDVSLFLERMIRFFCAFKNVRFVLKKKNVPVPRKITNLSFLNFITLYFLKFSFLFFLFLQKVKTNWNYSFGYLIISESKLIKVSFLMTRL